jgi:hypothetical protein
VGVMNARKTREAWLTQGRTRDGDTPANARRGARGASRSAAPNRSVPEAV